MQRVDSTSSDLPGAGPIYALRKLWKTGLVDRFQWKSSPSSFRGYLVQGIAILKPEFRGMCDATPYLEGAVTCDIVIARSNVAAITGIVDVGVAKRVEFEVRAIPTDAGRRLHYQENIRRGAAGFVRYDDGWRVVELQDPRVGFRIPD